MSLSRPCLQVATSGQHSSFQKSCRFSWPSVWFPTAIYFGLESIYAMQGPGCRRELPVPTLAVEQNTLTNFKMMTQNGITSDIKPASWLEPPAVAVGLQSWVNVCLVHDFKALPIELCEQSRMSKERAKVSALSCILGMEPSDSCDFSYTLFDCTGQAQKCKPTISPAVASNLWRALNEFRHVQSRFGEVSNDFRCAGTGDAA